jgi:hypothetical protein
MMGRRVELKIYWKGRGGKKERKEKSIIYNSIIV